MDKADIEFTVGLNTSSAEQQLEKLFNKMRTPGVSNRTEPLLQQVAKEYQQGFKLVGGTYDSGSNRFGVPSTQVLNTALATTTQTVQKFNTVLSEVIYMSSHIIDDYLRKATIPQIGYTPTSFTEYRNNAYSRLKMMGNPYSTDFNLKGDAYNGYLAGGNNYGVPSTIVTSGGLIRGAKTVSNWSPSEFYTREQVKSLNNPEAVFDFLVKKRNANADNQYIGVFDTFNRLHSAQGMYNMWQSTFGKNYENSTLALPAPGPQYKMQPWHDKNMAEINKNDNTELKDKLLLWSKIGATIFAIKKVLQGLSKVWKFGVDTTTTRNQNINEELGYFSTDPVGAMNANVDKTRSMLYAGIRNMGANAPVSKSGLDYASNKFTELWTSAMSGRNVDARTTIDVQRLKDFFGIDLTVAGLLTGQREGKTATDIQLDVMRKVETQLSKLNEADPITKGQVIDSLKNVLGEEMIDAIVANYSKNLKIDAEDLKITVAERIMDAGASALSPQDLTEKTTSAVTALSEFNVAIETLKNTLTVTLAPAFESFVDSLTTFVNWINRKVTKKEGEKDETGAFSSDVAPEAIDSSKPTNWVAKSASSKGTFGTPSERAKRANELLKGAKTASDVLDAVYLLNPFIQGEGSVEGLRERKFVREAGIALSKGNLDPESKNPLIRKLATYEYNGLTGINAIRQAARMGEFGNLNQMAFLQNLLFDETAYEDKTVEDFLPKNYSKLKGEKKENAEKKAQAKLEEYNYRKNQKLLAAINQLQSTDFMGKMILDLFGEGGEYDFNPKESISGYLLNPYSYETPEDYYNAVKSLKESFETNNWGKEYIKSFNLPSIEELAGEDKKLDFGEVKFTLTLTDQGGKVLGSKEIVGSVQ